MIRYLSCVWHAVGQVWHELYCVMKPFVLLLLLAFILVVRGKMSMLSNKSNASKMFVAFHMHMIIAKASTGRACLWLSLPIPKPTLHTPCSDARNQRSITFTEQQDLATRILQEHAVSYFGNICHNACHFCCNGINQWHFHTSWHLITHNDT